MSWYDLWIFMDYRVQNGSTARWHTMALSKWHGYGCQNYDFPNMISDPVWERQDSMCSDRKQHRYPMTLPIGPNLDGSRVRVTTLQHVCHVRVCPLSTSTVGFFLGAAQTEPSLVWPHPCTNEGMWFICIYIYTMHIFNHIQTIHTWYIKHIVTLYNPENVHEMGYTQCVNKPNMSCTARI